jgi:hypothetical protein
MRLNVHEVNSYLQAHLGQYEDSLQQAWLEIVERDPETFNDVALITRKVKNRAIRQYLKKKFTEKSLHEPIGRNGNDGFTLESILASDADDCVKEDADGMHRVYLKIIDFLIGEYTNQKEQSAALKRRAIELKADRLRLREESLRFKRERFESWKRLMEEKGREKEIRLRLRIQLQRERFEVRLSQFPLLARNR